jgi:predicted nucleotidyltransferase
MRLTTEQINAITANIRHHLGGAASIWLFGSRVDDSKRGGDVDLYVEATPHSLMQELRCKMQLSEELDIPVDLIVRPVGNADPIARIAKNEGMPL